MLSNKPYGSVRLTFPLVWEQDYGGEKSLGIGVDGRVIAAPPLTPLCNTLLICTFQEVISSVNFSWAGRLHGRNHIAHCWMNCRNIYHTLLSCTFQEVISSVNLCWAGRLHGRNHFAHCRMNCRNNYQKSVKKQLKTCNFGGWGYPGGLVEPAWKKVPKKDPHRENNQTAFGGHFGQILV